MKVQFKGKRFSEDVRRSLQGEVRMQSVSCIDNQGHGMRVSFRVDLALGLWSPGAA